MALDPQFADLEFRRGVEIADAVFKAFGRTPPEPLRINIALLHSPEWLREDIATLEEEIAGAEKRIAAIQKLLADLPVELIEKRRDIAEFRQAIIQKRAELAKAEAGNA